MTPSDEVSCRAVREVGFLCGMLPLDLGSDREEQELLDLLSHVDERLHKISPQTNREQCHAWFEEGYLTAVASQLEARLLAANLFHQLGFHLPAWLISKRLARRRIEAGFGGSSVTCRLQAGEIFESRYGVSLRSRAHEVSKGWPGVDEILSAGVENTLLEETSETRTDDREDILASQIRTALDDRSWGVLIDLFRERSELERFELCEAFDRRDHPRTVTGEIKRLFQPLERQLIADTISHGTVEWGRVLFAAVHGIGTDEETVRAVIKRVPPAELPNVREVFHQEWYRKAPWYERPFPHLMGVLDRRLWIECGGDCWFDLSEYFAGLPGTIAERCERFERWYQHEKSGFLLRIVDRFLPDSPHLQRARESLLFYRQPASGVDCAPAAVELRFAARESVLEFELEWYRTVKHRLGPILTICCVSPIAASVLFSFSIAGISLGQTIAVVAVTSCATRLLVKRGVKGMGYHRDEALFDIFFGAIDGALFFLNRFFRHSFIRFGARALAKAGLKRGIRGFTPAGFRNPGDQPAFSAELYAPAVRSSLAAQRVAIEKALVTCEAAIQVGESA